MPAELNAFLTSCMGSIEDGSFVKITFSKPLTKSGNLTNVYGRRVSIKGKDFMSLTYRYSTKDEVKNIDISATRDFFLVLLKDSFRIATLFTLNENIVLQTSKKGKCTILKQKPSISEKPKATHDKKKMRLTGSDDRYLVELGVLDKNGSPIPKMVDKYRQINKFLEIAGGLISKISLDDPVKIVDMGSGKGYLTFALYDLLANKWGRTVHVKGVEQRKDLVDFCNTVAGNCGFTGLSFECGSIDSVHDPEMDVLIALHACDTATDDAINKGINAGASLIVCAPCCHKQIRKQLKGKTFENPVLKYGIFKERELEMVTDTIRAMILEKNQYKTSIFEFVSNEHTRKNILLVGTKVNNLVDKGLIDDKIEALKNSFGITYHYLEKLRDSFG